MEPEILNLLPELAAYSAITVPLTWGMVEVVKPIPWLLPGYYRAVACAFGVLVVLLLYLSVHGHPWAAIVVAGLAIGALTTGAEHLRQQERDKPKPEIVNNHPAMTTEEAADFLERLATMARQPREITPPKV